MCGVGHDLKEIVSGDRQVAELSSMTVVDYLGESHKLRTIPTAFMHDDVAEVLQKVSCLVAIR